MMYGKITATHNCGRVVPRTGVSVLRRFFALSLATLFFAIGAAAQESVPTADVVSFGSLADGMELSQPAEAMAESAAEEEPTMMAAAGFNFALSGTGNERDEAIRPKLIDQYQFTDEGNQRFISPNTPASDLPISLSAEAGWKGPVTDDGEVYILYGDCRLVQGPDMVAAPMAVVWLRNIAAAGEEKDAIVYLEKENQWEPLRIELDSPFVAARTNDMAWLGTFRTSSEINLHIAEPGTNQLDPDAVYRRAMLMRSQPLPTGEVQNIPLTSRLSDRLSEADRSAGGKFGFRRIRLLSRYDREMTIRTEADPTDPTKNRWIINGGFTLIIEGISNDGKTVSDVVDLSADNGVIWAPGLNQLQQKKDEIQSGELDLELYLDGDIVFREGEQVVYAKKMYYDVKNRVGLIQDTEMVMPVPDTPGGMFRIKADSIAQNGPDSLTAKNAWVSTSRMGRPSYRLQSNTLTAESRSTPLYDIASGQPIIDRETGRQKTDKTQYVIAENNFVALESVPVFYWPWMAMDTKNQTLYIRDFQIAHDSTFGTQIRTGWNPYQLLNMSDCRPDGTDWGINIDWLSKRGLGHGTTFTYNRESVFGLETPAFGMFDFYGISDKGTDNLGLGRRNVPFPDSYRYRALWKHKQMFSLPGCLGDNWVATAQLGTSSDRNYLREYFEEEWFTNPNPQTSLEIKKTCDNQSFGLAADFRIDKFYTDTNDLPRLDHFWLGQPLIWDKLVWYEHTKLGYAQFRTLDAPYAAEDRALFRYLDWELAPYATSNVPNAAGTSTLSRNSFNFSTRHELDVPFELGPVKITPYALGEYAFWGEGETDNNINRLYGRGGMRMNLPVWKVNSDVASRTWYLNGIAHKMNFAVDGFYSRSNKDYTELVLYDQLDDWQVQDFRRQYSVTTFSNSYEPYRDSIPVRFDERYYAIRQGLLGGAVASGSTEMADDLSQVRFEWLNRWQTKRGPVGKRHIADWITFNTGLSLYPEKEQNFNEYVGLVDYDLKWHVGDRFSVLSSGLFDFFESGQQIVRAGVMAKRPSVSSLYLGVDRLGGPIDSTYLNAAINYRMSEKWAASFSNSYDLGEGRNVGQELGVSRIGESFIFTLSTNVNQSKDNWGVNLNVLPIFIFNNKKFEEDVLGFGQM